MAWIWPIHVWSLRTFTLPDNQPLWLKHVKTLTKIYKTTLTNKYNYFDKYIHLTINHWPISSTLLPPSLHHIDYFFGSVDQQHHLTVGQGSQGGLGLGEERAPAVLVAQVVQARVEVLLVVVVPAKARQWRLIQCQFLYQIPQNVPRIPTLPLKVIRIWWLQLASVP